LRIDSFNGSPIRLFLTERFDDLCSGTTAIAPAELPNFWLSQIDFNDKEQQFPMTASRGKLHFHRLFDLRQLGLANSEPFVDRIIREFLKIGEAVAGRWIEMPHGILLLQMVPGSPSSGAIYLYDRKQQVFYMVGFDGPDDNLTVEEFEQLVSEYGLLRYAERPSLMRVQSHILAASVQDQSLPMPNFTLEEMAHLLSGHALFRCANSRFGQFDLHSPGSA
jgi:hypothetical protein